MGKIARSSRKWKKAWRANISTEDIDDFFEKSTKDALSGGSVAGLASDALFFVHKSRDLSSKQKIEKHREKVLRYESMLQKNPFVQAVPSSTTKKSKDCLVTDSSMFDLWEGENEGNPRKKSKHSIIPAVEVEPPGCSFNPSRESQKMFWLML